MPLSAVRKFTDPDEYFAEVRNVNEGLVLRRGEFRAELKIIELPRLWMCRFDENLPRIMRVTPSGRRAWIVFATHPERRAMLMNGIEISQGQIDRGGACRKLPSIFCALRMGYNVFGARGSCRRGGGHYWARIAAANLRSRRHSASSRSVAVA